MNFWIDLDRDIKHSILRRAVENGYLKKDFVEDMIALEVEERGSYDSKRDFNIGSRFTR
jgi:hypothetical protein